METTNVSEVGESIQHKQTGAHKAAEHHNGKFK